MHTHSRGTHSFLLFSTKNHPSRDSREISQKKEKHRKDSHNIQLNAHFSLLLIISLCVKTQCGCLFLTQALISIPPLNKNLTAFSD